MHKVALNPSSSVSRPTASAAPRSSTRATSGASSNLAIQVLSGPVNIFNSGIITGFVLLDADDTMVNQAGGTFEARLTSDFDATGAGGNDLFRNEEGATVHALEVNGTQPGLSISSASRTPGLISMVDGDVGDVLPSPTRWAAPISISWRAPAR